MSKLITWIENFILCKKYPFLRVRNVWTKKKYGYSSTELDMLPSGWKKRFGLDICKDLSNVFKKSKVKNFDKRYFISQIKEKYGTLRWYDNGVPEDICKEYDKIMAKYEELSGVTCIDCGNNAKMRDLSGWYEPLCDECLERITKREEDIKGGE